MQPPNLLKYSNGWGHLLMSIMLLATGIILILIRDTATTAVGIGLITTVAGYWFVSSSANAQQQAFAAQHAATIQVNPPALNVLPPAPVTTPAPVAIPVPTGGQSETHQ